MRRGYDLHVDDSSAPKKFTHRFPRVGQIRTILTIYTKRLDTHTQHVVLSFCASQNPSDSNDATHFICCFCAIACLNGHAKFRHHVLLYFGAVYFACMLSVISCSVRRFVSGNMYSTNGTNAPVMTANPPNI